MKKHAIALMALSFITCQALDPRLSAAAQKQDSADNCAENISLDQQDQPTASIPFRFQTELNKAAQAHPKVVKFLLALNLHAHEEYMQTAANIECLPKLIKELPTKQELLQEIEELKEKQKKIQNNPNAAVQDDIDQFKQQIDDLGILVSVVGVISAVVAHTDMHSSVKDSYPGKICMKIFREQASTYFYEQILQHPTIKQYAAQCTIGNFTFKTSLANLLYGGFAGVKCQPLLALTGDYACTWASICLAQQIKLGVYFNKYSPRKIPGTDIVAICDHQVVQSAVDSAAALVAQWPQKSPSLSAFMQKTRDHLLQEATYNAAVQLAYRLAQAQGIPPERIEEFLPKDCFVRTPQQLAVKITFNELLPAAFTDKNLEVLLQTGLFAAQTATGDLNYLTLKLPGNITLLKDGQCVDACLEAGKTLVQQYIEEYTQQSILSANVSNTAKDIGVNMATYIIYNVTSHVLHSVAEHSDLINKEVLETLFPKDLNTKTARQLITKFIFRKAIQHAPTMTAHAMQGVFENIQSAADRAKQLSDMNPRVLWALKHPIVVNGTLLAAQEVTSNINAENPIKLPGTDAVLITQGQIVDAGLKAGAQVTTTKDSKLLPLLAKEVATQATYNGATQLIHKAAQCSGIDKKHVEIFFPKDCNATTWTQRVTALLCKYGITQASTTLSTIVGAAMISTASKAFYDVNLTGIA